MPGWPSLPQRGRGVSPFVGQLLVAVAVLADVWVFLLCGQSPVFDGVLDGIEPTTTGTAMIIFAVAVNELLLTPQHNLACSTNTQAVPMSHCRHPSGQVASQGSMFGQLMELLWPLSMADATTLLLVPHAISRSSDAGLLHTHTVGCLSYRAEPFVDVDTGYSVHTPLSPEDMALAISMMDTAEKAQQLPQGVPFTCWSLMAPSTVGLC